jgi:hypothetical protein
VWRSILEDLPGRAFIPQLPKKFQRFKGINRGAFESGNAKGNPRLILLEVEIVETYYS